MSNLKTVRVCDVLKVYWIVMWRTLGRIWIEEEVTLASSRDVYEKLDRVAGMVFVVGTDWDQQRD